MKAEAGKLTDGDFDKVEDEVEELFGFLRKKYGDSREKAKEEFDRRIRRGSPGFSGRLYKIQEGRRGMILLEILAGVALLVAGRRMFWLFVGLIGFISGIRVGAHFFPGQPEWMILAIALMAGVLGALLAFVLQWLAIGLAGFLAGAYIIVSLPHLSGWGASGIDWLFFFIGGILGTLLIIVLFDLALIILSSLAGAGLVIEPVHADRWVTALLFIGLFIVGVVVQSRVMRMKRP